MAVLKMRRMQAADTIDFARDDVGPWLIFALFGLTGVLGAFRGLIGLSFRRAARRLLTGLVIGLLFGAPFFLAAEIGLTWSSEQWFVRLRVEQDRVVLGYRWPNEDLAIPVRKISAVSIIYERRFRHSTHRAQIEVGTNRLLSFGFGRTFTPQEQAVWDRLAALVDQNPP